MFNASATKNDPARLRRSSNSLEGLNREHRATCRGMANLPAGRGQFANLIVGASFGAVQFAEIAGPGGCRGQKDPFG